MGRLNGQKRATHLDDVVRLDRKDLLKSCSSKACSVYSVRSGGWTRKASWIPPPQRSSPSPAIIYTTCCVIGPEGRRRRGLPVKGSKLLDTTRDRSFADLYATKMAATRESSKSHAYCRAFSIHQILPDPGPLFYSQRIFVDIDPSKSALSVVKDESNNELSRIISLETVDLHRQCAQKNSTVIALYV